ncbi:MAG: hypothetical protein ACREIV_07415, partial [Planctomycetaceae bacterium]
QLTRKLPVEVWALGDHFTLGLDGTKPVRRVVLDETGILPDIARNNNMWGAARTSTDSGAPARR